MYSYLNEFSKNNTIYLILVLRGSKYPINFFFMMEWYYKTNRSQENANLTLVFEKKRRGILDWLWSWSFYMHSSHIKHSFTHEVWHFNILRKYHHFISCWLWMWFTNTSWNTEHQTNIPLFLNIASNYEPGWSSNVLFYVYLLN